MTELTRHDYLMELAKKYNVKPTAWHVIEHLVNEKKNYDSAVALMFDLKWRDEGSKAWLIRASQELAKLPTQFPGKKFDYNYLHQWACYYETDIEAPPKKV